MFEKIIELINKYTVIIIHRHSSPDGDAVGSQTGLAALIRENFEGKTVYTVGDSAGRYSFMEDSETDVIGDGVYSGALAVILDTAAPSLVSDARYTLAAQSVRIDHHLYCETFTDFEIIDTSFESCAGMIAAFAKEQGLKLSQKSAKAIFTGMITDSGRFRYDSTSSRTFALASYLTETGFDMTDVYRSLYADELSSVQLRAKFTGKIRLFENSPVAYIFTTKEELAQTGKDVFSISRGMVGVMSDIKGVDIWVNFTDTGGEVLCELRSSKYNINPVAVKYGGGGHKKASGASVADCAEAMRMLADLKKLTEADNE